MELCLSTSWLGTYSAHTLQWTLLLPKTICWVGIENRGWEDRADDGKIEQRSISQMMKNVSVFIFTLVNEKS